jgi:hypothetical protein
MIEPTTRQLRQDPASTPRAAQVMQAAFATLALGSLALGGLIYVFAARLEIDEATARIIATAFIGAGVIDAAVLYYWDRLFRRA